MMLQNSEPIYVLDVVVYENYGEDCWAQEKYLVHTIDDVLWTSSIESVINCIRAELEKARGEGE
jgi:hypothetical protein